MTKPRYAAYYPAVANLATWWNGLSKNQRTAVGAGAAGGALLLLGGGAFAAYSSIASVRGIEKTTPAFRKKLVEMAKRLGANPDHIAAVISFESNATFSPSITNEIGATGLIQFMPDTARQLGTTTAALRALTAEQQLDWVEKYFRPYRGKLTSLASVYAAVFWPAAVDKPGDYVIAQRGGVHDNVYRANPAFASASGVITKNTIAGAVQRVLNAASALPRISVGAAAAGGASLVALAVGGILAWRWYAKRRAGHAIGDSWAPPKLRVGQRVHVASWSSCADEGYDSRDDCIITRIFGSGDAQLRCEKSGEVVAPADCLEPR